MNESDTNSTPPQRPAEEQKISYPLFPRIGKLLSDLNNPEITFSAILGAGISVSAGYSAFRSTDSVFQEMQQEYCTWPDKNDEEDSFLSYAFSVRAILNDPRVHFRVLHKFDKSVYNHVISPTISHCFLSYLAEIGRLSKVITENVDELEEAAGLRRLLGSNLIEAHGIFKGPGMCINQLCQGLQCIEKMRSQDFTVNADDEFRRIYTVMQQFDSRAIPRKEVVPDHDLKIDINALRISESIFMQSVYDNCVPCCPYCGCALKSSMVMYGEEINVDCRALKMPFFESQSLLVIGTSMVVYPLSMLPLTTSADVSLHFISKKIDFHRYLKEELIESRLVYEDLIQKRYDRVKYRNSDKLKQQVIQSLNTNELTPDELDVAINKITPNFSFHQGESDVLINEVLSKAPQMAARVNEIYKNARKEAEIRQKRPEIGIQLEMVKYGSASLKVQEVVITIPELFPPDAVIYEYKNTYGITCLCTDEQVEVIKKWFSDYLEIERTVEQQIVLMDTRFKTKNSPFDQVVYRPIGGHWACYCIGYNAYELEENEYVEELDPWSSNFLGYRQKGVYCERNNYFCYSGVYRNYITMKEIRGDRIREYFRHTRDLLENIEELVRAIINK